MSVAPTYPQELINSIIALFPRDFTTLGACSLVSRSFRGPSQEFIFREVNLLVPSELAPELGAAGEGDVPSKQTLHETLASSARLSSYVLSFILRIANPSTSTTYSGVLRNISRVHTLKLYEAPSVLHLDWEPLQDELKSDVLRLLRSPTLVHLELDQIKGFPLNILRHCFQLVHLRMISNDKRAVAFDITSDPLPLSDSDTIQGFLKVLEVQNPVISQQLQVALGGPSSRLSLTGLLSYETLVASEEGADQCHIILQMSATSLQTFVVDVRPPILFHQPLVLHELRSLSRVRFRSTTYDSLPYIHDALETVSEANTLGTVELVLWLEPFTPDDQDIDAWHHIDTLLTRERHAAHLRRVVVNIRDVDDECSDSEVVAFFKEAMPKLHSAGYLHIEIGYNFRA